MSNSFSKLVLEDFKGLFAKNLSSICLGCGEEVTQKIGDFVFPRNCSCKLAEYNRLEQIEKESLIFQKEAMYRKRVENSGIPTRYNSVTFDNSHQTPGLKKAIALIHSEKWILIVGGVGTGKTHIACCFGNQAISDGIPVRFIDFFSVINAYQSADFVKKDLYLSDICKAKLLIIDDYGVENLSPFSYQIAYKIINDRYSNMMRTIITTNMTIKSMKFATNTDTQRLNRRILESSEVIGE